MKKKVLFWGLAILIVVGIYVFPKMVVSAIPTVYYVTPNLKTYENLINCTGTVQSEHVQEIYLQTPIVAKEVCVGVGDMVSKDDVLLRIDPYKTEKLTGASLIKDISDDVLSTKTGAIDWASLASMYGLSAVVNGGLNYNSIANLLSGSGLLSELAPTSGTIVESEKSTQITAPMTGVVTDVNIKQDVPTSVGQAIITLSDTRHYKVMVSVNEGDIAKIKLGDKAKVRGVGFGGKTYTGTVTKIYPTARKALGSATAETVVDVEIVLDNADQTLKSGFSAKVEIVGGNNYDLITVPYEAIKQDENNDEYVYVYKDGKLKKQVVTTGQELTNEVEILNGVTYDSVVVYNPSDIIKEGAMIHIKGRANAD